MPKENVMPEIPSIITHVPIHNVHKCKGQNQLKRKQKKRELHWKKSKRKDIEEELRVLMSWRTQQLQLIIISNVFHLISIGCCCIHLPSLQVSGSEVWLFAEVGTTWRWQRVEIYERRVCQPWALNFLFWDSIFAWDAMVDKSHCIT